MAANFLKRLNQLSGYELNNLTFQKTVLLESLMTGRSAFVLNKNRLIILFKNLSEELEKYSRNIHISEDGGGVVSYFITFNPQNVVNLIKPMNEM